MARQPNIVVQTWNRFWGWVRRTLDFLCERPDHLQRLAIIGAGFAIYPLVLGIIWIVWKGYGSSPEILSQSLGIMGFIAYGLLALFALVVVSLLGTIKGLRIMGPGGSGIEIDTTMDDPDMGPETPRNDITIREGGRGRGRERYDRSRPRQDAPPVESGGKAPGQVTE